MRKLLLEYRNVPAILNHRLAHIDKTTFITVYTTGQYDYRRIDFDDLATALDFTPENSILKLTFVYIESKQHGRNYLIYQSIAFTNNKLVVDNAVTFIHEGFKFSIDFGLETFRLKKVKFNGKSSARQGYDISYSRRKVSKAGTVKTYEFLDIYYQLFPRFEDIFLETLFMLDIMLRNPLVAAKDQLEAYFLQGKMAVERDQIPQTLLRPGEARVLGEKSTEQTELSNLTGLNKIKLEIEELKSLAQFRKKRIELGLPVSPSTLHMVFTGNPGTGKTTVARLLGQIYFDIGLLASSKVVEVSRGDLVGEYVGHTSPKTQKVFYSALGGVLFIDEAYSLFKAGNDFGNEAVETLLKLMEDNREKIVVIIAGYPKEIEELLVSNPGLKSRFSKSLHFEDYSKEELIQIFEKMVSDYHNQLSEAAHYKMEYFIDRYYDSGYFKSNARAIRNIFEETIKKQSSRLSKVESPTQDEMITFTDKDIPENF